MLDRGRQEGRQIGRQEGLQEGVIKTARNMKKIGVYIAIIKQATGLSEKEIAKL